MTGADVDRDCHLEPSIRAEPVVNAHRARNQATEPPPSPFAPGVDIANRRGALIPCQVRTGQDLGRLRTQPTAYVTRSAVRPWLITESGGRRRDGLSFELVDVRRAR